MSDRIKVRAIRAANGRIQGWAVDRGNRELFFSMSYTGAMNHAQVMARLLAHHGVGVRTWEHGRKGRIRGVVVREDHMWMWVRLCGDHKLRYMASWRQGQVDEDGDVLCLRRSFMTEITEETTP